MIGDWSAAALAAGYAHRTAALAARDNPPDSPDLVPLDDDDDETWLHDADNHGADDRPEETTMSTPIFDAGGLPPFDDYWRDLTADNEPPSDDQPDSGAVAERGHGTPTVPGARAFTGAYEAGLLPDLMPLGGDMCVQWACRRCGAGLVLPQLHGTCPALPPSAVECTCDLGRCDRHDLRRGDLSRDVPTEVWR